MISHTLNDIFPSPATLEQAIKNTWNLMKDPQGTINKVYDGVPKVSSDALPISNAVYGVASPDTPPVDLSGDLWSPSLSGDFSDWGFSLSFYDSWIFDSWADSWGDSWGDSWD
jgi:hypothetical protein